MNRSLSFTLIASLLSLVILGGFCSGCSSQQTDTSSDTTTTTAATTTTTVFTTYNPGSAVDLSMFTSFVTDDTVDSVYTDGGVVGDPQYHDETDIKRFAVAVDGGRLYLYAQMVGTFQSPAETTSYGTEEINNRSFHVDLDLDRSSATGITTSGIDASFTFSVSTTAQSACYWVYPGADAVYNHDDAGTNTLLHNGGVGYDYVVMSISPEALAPLGITLTKGASVEINAWAETASTNYEHFSYDPLGVNETTAVDITLGGP